MIQICLVCLGSMHPPPALQYCSAAVKVPRHQHLVWLERSVLTPCDLPAGLCAGGTRLPSPRGAFRFCGGARTEGRQGRQGARPICLQPLPAAAAGRRGAFGCVPQTACLFGTLLHPQIQPRTKTQPCVSLVGGSTLIIREHCSAGAACGWEGAAPPGRKVWPSCIPLEPDDSCHGWYGPRRSQQPWGSHVGVSEERQGAGTTGWTRGTFLHEVAAGAGLPEEAFPFPGLLALPCQAVADSRGVHGLLLVL